MEYGLLLDAIKYNRTLALYNIDRDFNELYYKDGKDNYNKIINRLRHIDLPDIDSFIYSKLSLKEIVEILEEVLNKILGNSFYKKIKSFRKKIILDSSSFIYEGNTLIKIRKYSTKLKSICICDELYSIHIITLAHEYMHAILSKYISRYNEVLGNVHYDELISIFIEYLVCYDISGSFKKDHLIDKDNIIRLDALKRACYHLNNSNNYLCEVESYINHMVFGYVVSDIYASRLLEIYKDDKKVMNYIINILKGEEELENMIDYYDLSLDNNTIITFNNKLDKYDNMTYKV